MSQGRLPDKIYVSNEKGGPRDTAIYDAATGKPVEGVIEVHVSGREAEVVFTPSWPIAKDDYVHNDPHYSGDSRDGVKVEKRSYPIKRMEIESW